ncbi:hypothetical protein D3227_21835 [Mesorhizobium waimense]|uniref:Uncharacterized protein n=1 Tax=Mesorhizobium waimense TaxID=1300307 RepID=A0A3A5KI04_9HYPH|nr:hypothetical protein D3227_21835 [Mesorhizobium waimense]
MQSFGDPTQHREDRWLGQGDFGVRYMLATLGRLLMWLSRAGPKCRLDLQFGRSQGEHFAERGMSAC